MNADPNQAKAIFLEAVEKHAPEQWTAFLDESCASQPELRRRVEVLLEAHREAGTSQHQAVVEDPSPGAGSVSIDRSGSVIGSYKLLQQIGEGGMGTVWMAEQTHPVQRKVALKLIKSGMDSQQVIARFEAERQALALMDHPNIARVLDAGETPPAYAGGSPRPYFVMELVKGVPITRYCDEHHLTPRQRLELFVPVCQAVQHAHQKGIIHRDLKPSNVMVCLYDGKPVPKIIDFGIAKAAGPRLTEKTLFTELGQVVGTLEYMSPEQAELNQLDIDTRSDIYSLGVLLYELLTGTTPLERKRFQAVAFLEVLRLIREEESPRPSTRLSTAEGLPSIAANRGLEPKKLSGLMRGELDWIVMKTLEKDRNRRYETANGFAMDLLRYLADEPVQAGPPSARYRLRKFLRRNRRQVLAASLVLLALVGGIIGTTLGLLQAKAAAKQANNEAIRAGLERDRADDAREEERKAKEAESVQRKRAEAARDRAAAWLEAMTSKVAGDVLTQQTVLTPEQKTFLTTALGYYQELLKESARDEQSRYRLAAAAYRLGLIEYRLGRKEQGAAMTRRARDLFAQLSVEFPAVSTCQEWLGKSHKSLGCLLLFLGKQQPAETEFCSAIDIQKRLTAEFPGVAHHRSDLATSRSDRGRVLKVLGKLDQAETEYRAAVALSKQLADEFPAVPEYRSGLALGRHNLGNLLQLLGERGQARREFRAGIAILEQLATEFPTIPDYRKALAGSHNSLGHLLRALGKPNQAETEHRTAIDLQQKLAAEFPSDPEYRAELAMSYTNLGNLLTALQDFGKPDQAETMFREGTNLLKKLAAEFPAVPEYRRDLAGSHRNLGNLLHASGKSGLAETEYRAAIDLSEKLLAEFPGVPDYRHRLATNRYCLGRLLQATDKPRQAETEYRTAIDLRQQLVAEFPAVPGYRQELALCRLGLGAVLRALRKLDQAETELRAAIDVYKQFVADFPSVPRNRVGLAASHTHLGILLEDLAKPEQAETEYRAALAIHEKLVVESPAVPEYRRDLAKSHQNLGAVLRKLRKPDQTETQYRAAIAIRKKLAIDFPAYPENTLELGGTLCNLGNLLSDGGRLKEALAWFDQAVAILATLVQKEPKHLTAQQYLRNCHWGRASSLDKLKRHGEAVKDWEKALALSTGNFRILHQYRLMISRAAAGQIELAMKDADQLAKIDSKDVLYNCACVYALAHAKSKDDKHAARALELLRRAIAKGFREADQLKNDTDFDSLRQRDDFKKLLAELEAKEKSGR